MSSVGSMRMCAGLETGCEVAIHAMHTMFEDKNKKQSYWLMQPMDLIP